MKHPRPYRPQGQMTRGKTARNRLRRSDIFMLLTEGSLIRRKDPPGTRSFYVDLGYGFEPFTTLEAAERLRRASVLIMWIWDMDLNPSQHWKLHNG